MEYWPWWISGLALSGVMVFHWLTLHRMMAVSGRVTALIDRVRHGSTEPETALTPEEMLAAIQAATAAEFGEISPSDFALPSALSTEASTATVSAPPTRTVMENVLFLAGLICGGGLATALGAGFAPTLSINSSGFLRLSGESPLASALLLAIGGGLVGFGTRMSGGCTSGHGLCGTSRLQPGSLLATLSFFSVGILVSFGIQALL